MTADPLLRFRPEFPILEKTTYRISNSLFDRAFKAIDEIRATRTWERWTDRPIVVT